MPEFDLMRNYELSVDFVFEVLKYFMISFKETDLIILQHHADHIDSF